MTDFNDDELMELMLNETKDDDKKAISELLEKKNTPDEQETKKTVDNHQKVVDQVIVMSKEDQEYMIALKRKMKNFKENCSDEPEIRKINVKDIDKINNLIELEAFYEDMKRTFMGGGGGGGISQTIYESGSNMIEDMMS